MESIYRYFSDLSPRQIEQFEMLDPLYREWNEKINVISRKDIDNLYIRHILHSLSIAAVISFRDGTEVIDLGTGGGFPGIPLAIIFPDVRFFLIDGTRKKLKVVEAVRDALELKNITIRHIRAEDFKHKTDFVISRAVTRLPQLWQWSRKLIKKPQINSIPNGLFALKGGDINAEINELPKGEYVDVYPLQEFMPEPTFEEKYLIYLQS
ncbi:MAG: 16S rRNA (guanine(527)-N(7))-methyltransferase RsmG [Bacteroidota bacterium]